MIIIHFNVYYIFLDYQNCVKGRITSDRRENMTFELALHQAFSHNKCLKLLLSNSEEVFFWEWEGKCGTLLAGGNVQKL